MDSEHFGCFVYLVLHPIRPRSRPVPGAAKIRTTQLEPGELIACDCICTKFSKTFLRLADGSGWIAATTSKSTASTSTTVSTVQQVAVEAGLWPLIVDNCPVGQALRRQPVDRPDMVDSVLYEPMQKVFCDRKVIHPQTAVTFYRVQGTQGWLMDLRHNETLLLEMSQVKFQLQLYQACTDLTIQRDCKLESTMLTPIRVPAGEWVATDIVRTTSDSAFARLTDGSGWLPIRKLENTFLKALILEPGSWELKVLNAPVGLSLRRHPMDSQDKIYSITYPSNTLLQADYRISRVVADHSIVNFYRVQGTTGWVFDKRDGTDLLSVIHHGPAAPVSSVPKPAWTLDFVRGVAATIDRLEEKQAHPNTQVLTFESHNGELKVVVYCSTRTVGMQPGAHEAYRWFRNCSSKELWQHLRKDMVEIMMNEPDKTPDVQHEDGANAEDEVRNSLILLDEQIQTMMLKRSNILKKIQAFDTERAKEAKSMREQVSDCLCETGGLEQRGPDALLLVHDSTLSPKSLEDEEGEEGGEGNSTTGSSSHSETSSERRQARRSPRRMSSPRRSAQESSTVSRRAVRTRINQLLLLRSRETDGSGGDFGESIEVLDEDEFDSTTINGTTFENDESDVEDEEDSTYSPRRCRVCRNAFANETMLVQHCRDVHGIYCDHCDKVFTSYSDLEGHRERRGHW